MEIAEQLEQQLAEERQNSNSLYFETRRLLINLHKANGRAAKAETTLDKVESQVSIIEKGTREMEQRVREAKAQAAHWQHRYKGASKEAAALRAELKEARRLLKLYEGVVDKLTHAGEKRPGATPSSLESDREKQKLDLGVQAVPEDTGQLRGGQADSSADRARIHVAGDQPREARPASIFD